MLRLEVIINNHDPHVVDSPRNRARCALWIITLAISRTLSPFRAQVASLQDTISWRAGIDSLFCHGTKETGKRPAPHAEFSHDRT